MVASRRISAGKCGPASICQTLVNSDGATSNAAACAGVTTTANTAMATVGNPMPITPLTNPASR